MRHAALLAALLAPLPLIAQRRPVPPVPAGPALGEWQMAGRDYAMTRYSPLDQITTANVGQLRPVWTFSTGSDRGHEGSPLVVGSMMFVHTPLPNTVFALNLAQPGAPIVWKYAGPSAGPAPRDAATASSPGACCDVGSRGLAYHPSGKLYFPLVSGDLAAIDARNGREIWRVRNADPGIGATLSAAPLVVGDLVVVGVAGSEFGVRGYLTAYDALTGRLVWRGYSTGPDADVLIDAVANSNYASHQGRNLGSSSWPADGWRHGGGATSGWISYDPALNLIYHGTDEPAPGNPAQRLGDNKWTSSILARDAGTGKVRWAFQLTPHDEWGYSGSNENILVDLAIRGSPVKALVHFDRNGFAYTLDRTTGKLLVAEKYGPANWARAIDLATALPDRDPQYAAPVATPAAPASPRSRAPVGPVTSGVCPASVGTKYLTPAAFSPLTSLFYLPLNNLCMDLRTTVAAYTPGQLFGTAPSRLVAGPGGNRGRFIAWDAAAASIAWEVKEPFAVTGGALTTAGGVVFYGTVEGWLKALDQKSGRELWRFKTPSGIVGNPIAFAGPDGKEYIAIVTGIGGWPTSKGSTGFPDLASITNSGGVLLVFGL